MTRMFRKQTTYLEPNGTITSPSCDTVWRLGHVHVDDLSIIVRKSYDNTDY